MKHPREQDWDNSQVSIEETTRKASKAQKEDLHGPLEGPGHSRAKSGKKRRPLPESSEEEVAGKRGKKRRPLPDPSEEEVAGKKRRPLPDPSEEEVAGKSGKKRRPLPDPSEEEVAGKKRRPLPEPSEEEVAGKSGKKRRPLPEHSEEEVAGKIGKKWRPLPKFSAEEAADEEENLPLEDMEELRPKQPKPVKERPSRGKQRKQKHERDSSRLPRTVPLSKANKEFYNERKWPGGVVRYQIKQTGGTDIEDVRRRLEEVNKILKSKTCTKLQEITEAETEDHEDYLVLDDSPDYVTGRVGGRQVFGVVELLKGGQHRQHTAMMVMAMLGFYFEVSRHDRDKYIRVHVRHVRPDKLHHFEKIREDATLPLPYDYESATHPAWQFWRQIGKTGISTVATYKTIDPDGVIMKKLGQNEKLLSELDLVKINSVYGVKCFRGDAERGMKDQGREDEVAEENDE